MKIAVIHGSQRNGNTEKTIDIVKEKLNSLGDNFVAFLPSDVRHKSDTARVMFVGRMIQTLRGRSYIRVLSTRRHGHVSSIGTNGRLGRCRMSCS